MITILQDKFVPCFLGEYFLPFCVSPLSPKLEVVGWSFNYDEVWWHKHFFRIRDSLDLMVWRWNVISSLLMALSFINKGAYSMQSVQVEKIF